MSCEAVMELASTRSTRSTRTSSTAAVAGTSARAGNSFSPGDGRDIASLGGDVDGWTASGWTSFKATEPVTKPRQVVAIIRVSGLNMLDRLSRTGYGFGVSLLQRNKVRSEEANDRSRSVRGHFRIEVHWTFDGKHAWCYGEERKEPKNWSNVLRAMTHARIF